MTHTFRDTLRHPIGGSAIPSFLALSLAAFVGCGGGRSSAPPAALAAADTPGVWIHTHPNDGNSYLLLLPSSNTTFTGRALVHGVQSQLRGDLNFSGKDWSGDLMELAPVAYADLSIDGPDAPLTSPAFAMGGSATTNPNTLTINDGNETSSYTRDPLGNPAASLAPTVASLAGSYLATSSATSTGQIMDLTITPLFGGPNGTMEGTFDAGTPDQVAFTGTIAPVAGAANAFAVTLAIPTFGTQGQSFTFNTSGLAFFRTTSAGSLVLMTDDDYGTRDKVHQFSAVLNGPLAP